MEKSSVTMLIGAFLAIIVGVSLISVVAQEGNDITNTINISGESVDYTDARIGAGTGEINTTKEFYITNVPTGWRITGCPVTNLVLYNDSSSLTLTADYTFTASTGEIIFNNTANVNTSDSFDNTTTATYVYCDSEYLTQGWNRTIIDLVPGFFALALMGVGIGLFYGVMRKEGILNV